MNTYIEQDMMKRTIAAVNSPAIYQGLSLILGCDIHIDSEKAKLGQVWIRRGIPQNAAGPSIL